MTNLNAALDGNFELIRLDDEHLMGAMSPIFSHLESVEDLLS